MEEAKTFLLDIWNYIYANPWQILIGILAIYIGFKLFLHYLRFFYHLYEAKHLVYLRVTLPKDDTPKDKEKETQKDFREKVAIMAQFFRNLYETRELNMMNTIRTRILHSNIFSFELVSHNKVVDFYVTTPRYYQELVIKQITSYYSAADIQATERYEHLPKGNKLKGYYAFQEKKYWFPMKTYKVVENDPLNSMTNVFSKMEDTETAVVQIVVSPVGQKWARKATEFGDMFFKGKEKQFGGIKIPIIGPILNIFKGIFLGFDKMQIEPKTIETGYVRMLQSKEDVAKRIGEKASQTGFDTAIRLLATAKTESRAEEICNGMIVGLSLFKDTSSNWLQTRRIFFIDWINDMLFLFNFKNRLLDGDSLFFVIGEKKSLLGEEELASLFHFPCSIYNYAPVIRWLDYKVLPAPVNLSNEGILLGYNFYRGERKDIHFKRADRSRHHYIIGKSGSGKSALLSYMARQDIKNGEGVCIIDPHGDLVDDVMQYIPKDRVKDVIIFDPSDTERPMGLNILEASTPEEMDLVATQATEIFIKIFGDEIFGPRIQHYFRNACLTLCEDLEDGATLIDVPRVFTDDAFLRYKVKKVKNPIVKSFWQNEYANTADRERQEMIPYFSAKFGPFITNTIMRNTIGQTKSAFDFRKVMDEGKILLVKLSKGKIGDLNTQLLGLVMVAKLQQAAMSRADQPEETRKDFFLYVDEFQNFATESFVGILSEARKYHLNLIMAHQYINQLVTTKFGVTSSQIRDAVFGNVGTISSFKVGAEDAEYMTKEYSPELSEQDVIGISNYKMYMKLNIDNTSSRPFSVATIWDTTGANPKIAEIAKEYSRLKHGRKKEFVEQEIIAHIGIEIDTPPVDMSKIPGQPNAASAPTGNAMAQLATEQKAIAATPAPAASPTPSPASQASQTLATAPTATITTTVAPAEPTPVTTKAA